MPEESRDDETMKLSTGSIVFSVQGVRFRLPTAILQRHRCAFSTMLETGNLSSDGYPVILNDSPDAFRDWVGVLLDPLDSCLNPSHPFASDLKRLLELLLLCHNYADTKLEAYTLTRVVPLTLPETLPANLINGLTNHRVLEVANLVGRPEIGAAAHEKVFTDIWRHQPNGEHAYEALVFGERIADRTIIGAAYYQVLLRKSLSWTEDRRLTDQHRRHLRLGLVRCAERWQQIINRWGRGEIFGHKPHKDCYLQDTWLQGIWKELARADLPFYDVIGKLYAAKRFASRHNCFGGGAAAIQLEIDELIRNMHPLFMPSDT